MRWTGFNDLEENLIFLDHADIVPGALFNGIGSLFQIIDFRMKDQVAVLKLEVFFLYFCNTLFSDTDLLPTTFSKP